ncbi:MAG: discoidin domain-containing protein, partial [Oscillospiraceae bacterium]|nr:discoidin domain-containing protein [Oscillospiraceae bacterium]
MENNFKRFLSLMLALIMVVGMMPMGHVHAEVTVDGNTISMVVGDTYTITLGNEEPVVSGGEGVVVAATNYTEETTKEFDRNAPVTDLDNFVNGTYVIYSARDGGSGSNAYTTNPVIANAITSGSKKGLEIVPLADIDERAYWTITKNDDGTYAISYNGLNISINAQDNVDLQEGAVVNIVNNDNTTYPDGVAITNSDGLCLNTYNSFGNASSTGQAASAWGTAIGNDGMQFYLYKANDVIVRTYSVTLTAETAGNAEITIGDTTYTVNVTVPPSGPTFTSEKLTGITGEASSVDTTEAAYDKSVANAFDGDLDTFWATVEAGTLEEDYLIANLGGEYLINKVEYTKRISGSSYNCTGNLLDYIIEVRVGDGEWQRVASGSTVDGTTEITFTPVKATQVRLTATQSYHWQAENANKVMTAAEFAVFKAVCEEHEWVDATCTAPKTCSVCGATEGEALGHTYTNEYDPDCNVCDEAREVKTFTSEQLTGITGEASSVDTSEPAYDKSVANAFDGDLSTFWATVEAGTLEEDYLIADLGAVYLINKAEYTKRNHETAGYNCTGNLRNYILEYSTDKETWLPLANGDTVDGTTVIEFAPVSARYVRLTSTSSYHWQEVNANKVMTVAEFAIFKAVCEEHDYDEGVVTAEPTCTEAGVKTFTCSVCGHTYTEEIDATGHSYDEGVVTTEPTCGKDGVKTFTCTCGDSYTEVIPATGAHTAGEAVKENETEDGYDMVIYCTVCKTELSRESFTNPVEEPKVVVREMN